MGLPILLTENLFCTKLHGLFSLPIHARMFEPWEQQNCSFQNSCSPANRFSDHSRGNFSTGLRIDEDFSPPQKLKGRSNPARQHPSSQLWPWQQHYGVFVCRGNRRDLSALLAHGQAGTASFLISLAGNPAALKGMKSALATKPRPRSWIYQIASCRISKKQLFFFFLEGRKVQGEAVGFSLLMDVTCEA